MSHETKRNTPGLSPEQLQDRGLPWLLCPFLPSLVPLNTGDGARGAQPMSWCSRQHICEGVGDALCPQEIRTCCTERASLGWIRTDARKWGGQEAESLATQSQRITNSPLSCIFFTFDHNGEE